MLRPVAFNQQFIAGMLRPEKKPSFSAHQYTDNLLQFSIFLFPERKLSLFKL
jgi:hypothetical protein